ncbi:MAG: glycosyltransferase family 4 protein [Candidatus Hydrogenedentes bacterium]|nr:glycosyltransferase family 4 protein [Candidatus Hydrogenedentota bacterium]
MTPPDPPVTLDSMRVGFDIGPITHARSGVGNYCLHLLKALLEIEGLDVTGFAAQARSLDLKAIGRRLPHRRLPIPTRAMYKVWSTFGAPSVDSLLGGVDLYHATNYFLPPVRRAKRVLTIHDITFKKHPELCSPKIVGPFSSRVEGFAREADAVIADSESTRQDIINLLGIPQERVHTVLLATDASMKPVPIEIARKPYGLNDPYILFVGTIEPRKNVHGLMKAFLRIMDEFPHTLVLVGSYGWYDKDAYESVVELAMDADTVWPASAQAVAESPDSWLSLMHSRIKHLEYVDQKDLPSLYSAADAFVFPSSYEGFGLPILEAMACGCPVITADNSSLPEVAGDAAEYCDANDVDSIANAMRRVLSDPLLREQMRQRGFAQAAKFSWEKTAEKTAAIYRSVCG